jgi:hypothetical protein
MFFVAAVPAEETLDPIQFMANKHILDDFDCKTGG